MKKKIQGAVAGLLILNNSQRRGVLALMPLMAVAVIFIHGARRTAADTGLRERADSILSGGKPAVTDEGTDGGGPFFFDPNTATLEQFCALGLELRVAASIVKYRNAGKRFTVPEDLAMCYGVTLEKYRELEPYIRIAEKEAPQQVPMRGNTPAGGNSHPADPPGGKAGGIRTPGGPFDVNLLDGEGFAALGFSPAQVRTILNYRNSIGGFTSAEQFGRCYAVSEDAFALLAPYIIIDSVESAEPGEGGGESEVIHGVIPPAAVGAVEINGADSAALRSVAGIGEVLVVRILDYRRRLGGFARAEQLAEIEGMTEANYERIAQQIRVDSCKIEKIDINFAPHKQLAQVLERHPYVNSGMARKILSARQLKGGWSNTEELVEDKIWSREDAAKMAPYVVFKQPEE